MNATVETILLFLDSLPTILDFKSRERSSNKELLFQELRRFVPNDEQGKNQ